MQARLHILPRREHPPARQMLSSSLWGPELFPEEAFENLKTRNPGKDLETLLGIRAKLPEDLQIAYAASASGTSSYEPAKKKQKFTHNNQNSLPPKVKQGWNKRGSRGDKKNQRGNKNKNSGNAKPNPARHTQNKGNNQGKTFQRGKKDANK